MRKSPSVSTGGYFTCLKSVPWTVKAMIFWFKGEFAILLTS